MQCMRNNYREFRQTKIMRLFFNMFVDSSLPGIYFSLFVRFSDPESRCFFLFCDSHPLKTHPYLFAFVFFCLVSENTYIYEYAADVVHLTKQWAWSNVAYFLSLTINKSSLLAHNFNNKTLSCLSVTSDTTAAATADPVFPPRQARALIMQLRSGQTRARPLSRMQAWTSSLRLAASRAPKDRWSNCYCYRLYKIEAEKHKQFCFSLCVCVYAMVHTMYTQWHFFLFGVG